MNIEFIKRLVSTLILVPLAFFIFYEEKLIFLFFLMICLFISFYEWFNMSKNNSYSILGYIFITVSFYTAYKIRYFNQTEENHIFLFIIIICILTDIGGYIFGKIIKGPKLTKISPNKTYSGLIGSFLIPLIFFIVLYNIPLKSNFVNYTNQINQINSYLIIILISSSSQIGDLIVSYFKRASKIKNTGNLIPGHGGLLDRIDGMLFAFPFAFLILKLIKI